MTQTPDAQKWGFYSVVPRVVRKEYKDLTHAEKWLYSCLRDLCGVKGTCFRTLRSLKEETGISIASLSAMIPHLHEAGLIHAERKARGRGGKEVWHITITDLWQANKEYCSNIEQQDSESMPVVQIPNNTSYVVVQIPNNFTGYVNFSEGVVQNLKLVVQNFDTEEGGTEEGNGNPTVVTDNKDTSNPHMCGSAIASPRLRLVTLDPLSEDMPEAQPKIAYSHRNSTLPKEKGKTENKGSGASDYMKPPTSQQNKTTRSRNQNQDTEQQELLEVDLGPLIMPPDNARWCAGTAVLISEVLRKKRYTPMQRANQIKAAERMFGKFKGVTREQFVGAFNYWFAWWDENMTSIFSIADLMAKARNGEIRLQIGIDSLTRKPRNTQTNNQIHKGSPNAPLLDEQVIKERTARNIEEKKARIAARDAQKAAMA